MSRLVAIVVTFNRLAQLQVTVPRLLAEALDAVVVVDNASTDGTGSWLAGLSDPKLHVLSLGANTGGAGGFAAGLEAAQSRFDPDWYVLMDDDARPHPGACASFLAREGGLRAEGYEAVAAGVFYPDGRICDMNRPSRNPFWHMADFLRTLTGGREGFHVTDEAYAPALASIPQPIDATSFVGFFLSRAGLERGGLPDARLFIYGDDVIYTLTLVKRGGKIAFLSAIGFEHDCSTYVAQGGDIYRPLWKVYYNYRNSLLAYRVAAGPVLFWPVLLLAAAKWRLRARHAGADRATYLKLWRLALRDVLMGDLSRPSEAIFRLAQP
ncbi:glycosyltransferase [Stagnihabitans tardus]|uniref:Glycosyltransferase n=1 Tax=Stagnihabitans tardus TaxID=2699202 RepID=A0AAE4Y9K7_9RHOB|nr:glycosyltransferase [Stagnihabitans tardus]NBZ87371.1 glycosyltransferase [Stagnihabitans tardus]